MEGNRNSCTPPTDERDRPPVRRGGASGAGPVQEVFGDVNLGVLMLFVVLLHMISYALRDPCTC